MCSASLWPGGRGLFAVAAVLAAGSALMACGDDAGEVPVSSSQIEHVHGLGVNPADDALMVATHSGLYRSANGADDLERVGETAQDIMGFSVIGPDRFLGSGHPAPGQNAPPNLGLIESTDAGESWQGVSLAGEADFHVLRYAHGRVYGFNGLTGTLMLGDDRGESWSEEKPPAPMIDLAVDPADDRRIIASTQRGLAISDDAGSNWTPLDGDLGLLAWPARERLYLIDAGGRVQVSEDAGQSWKTVGRVGAQPAALTAAGGSELYVALVDGSLMESSDGGASWTGR